MENIFEGAKFGDKFLTRDGRIAVFHLKTEDNYCYIVNGTLAIISCDKNGSYNRDTTFCGLDIVSRYQEPIDEQKLDELTDKAYDSDLSVGNTNWTDWDNAQDEIADAFVK